MQMYFIICMYIVDLWLNRLDDSGGIAGGDGVGRDGEGDDRTGTDGAVIADGDTGKDGHITAYPDVIADGDGFSPFASCGPFGRVGAVTSGVDMYARADETVVADSDRRFV